MAPSDRSGDTRRLDSANTRHACQQCRARKVRCDRADNCCGPCSRLSLSCSYGDASTDVTVWRSGPDSQDLTEAGIKRRRIRRACEPCRAVKAKCSGETPCARCRSKQIPCMSQQEVHQQQARRQSQFSARTQPPPPSPANNQTTPGHQESSFPTPVTSTSNIGDTVSFSSPQGRGEKEKAFVHAYFDTRNASRCLFLHAPTTLAKWTKGELDQTLVKTLCAAGLMAKDPSPQDCDQATAWFKEAQVDILGQLDRIPSLPKLQALVLVLYYHYESGHTVEAWNLLAVAARQAFTMKLNYERRELDPIAQETRRRVVWQIFLLDRVFSGGLEDLEVCPVKRMLNLRLPCEDRTFDRGMPSRAQFLIPSESQDANHSDMDIFSYLLRIYTTRDHILRYTKRVWREGSSPELSKDEFTALEAELNGFAESLPDDLRLSPSRLPLMACSRDALCYLYLHTVWLQCYVDLYRFVIPGIRESISQEAMQSTPPDFISYCQCSILSRVFQLCEMWSEFSKYQQPQLVDNIFLGVSIYQTTQILKHLRHMLGPGNVFGTVEDIKVQLHHAINMLNHSRLSRFSGHGRCLLEAEKVIRHLERGHLEVVSPPTRRGPEKDTHHLISKGSVIPRESSESDENDDQLSHRNQSEVQSAGHSPPGVGGGDEMNAGEREVSSRPDYHYEGFDVDFEWLAPGLMPWDPFAVQLSDTSEHQLGMLGLFTRI